MAKNIPIDPISIIPLQLESFLGDDSLMYGTGFIINHNTQNFLITNWHVVTCRSTSNKQPILDTGQADPDKLKIWYHQKDELGVWELFDEQLLNDNSGEKMWLEHPDGSEIDVVALPISISENVKVNPLDLNLSNTDLIITPSEPVSIVGFPYGQGSVGKFPIWKTGHIASDIDLDYDGKPVFLIDASTLPGMSGSPVIAKRIGMQTTSKGLIMGGTSRKFLGIYSGRIQERSELGIVWKPEVLDSILP